MNRSPWIISVRFDSAFILAPALVVSVFALIFSDSLEAIKEMPSWLWLLLIVGIDAGHVYSTLLRTYLVKSELNRRQALLTMTPLFAWLAGCLLYSIDGLWFWRALAYLAVFHFVRQQYGFMMIYARHEHYSSIAGRNLDKAAIYSSTIFPLIYWHCRGRHFNWFVEEDFVLIDSGWIWKSAALIYAAVAVLYLAKEIRLWRKHRRLNMAKNSILLGTALSWFIGIVAFDNDLIFTATNVITHGIPYYALTWAYGYKQNQVKPEDYVFSIISHIFSVKSAPVYIICLFLIAYFEEGIWDGLIWRERFGMFGAFNLLPSVESTQTLVWLVPLLALPQATHYLLDAYIWRLHRKDTDWKRILFHDQE